MDASTFLLAVGQILLILVLIPIWFLALVFAREYLEDVLPKFFQKKPLFLALVFIVSPLWVFFLIVMIVYIILFSIVLLALASHKEEKWLIRN